MNKERLNILKNALKEHHDNGIRFDISHWWVNETHSVCGQYDKDWCGTTACAMGLATTIPEFQEAGLIRKDNTVEYHYFDCSTGVPVAEHRVGFMAAQKFFDIDLRDAWCLFSPDWYKNPNKVTAKTVARRIAEYIRTEGKSAREART